MRLGIVRSALVIVLALIAVPSMSLAQEKTQQPTDHAIWAQFVSILRAGPMPAGKVRPHDPSLTAPMIEFLSIMREKANWKEWQVEPEIHRVGDRTLFVLPLTIEGKKQTFCFTFLRTGGDWYFQHMESILLRLDQVSALPVTSFPDIDESQKAWIREEIRVTEQVRVFNLLVDEKGKAQGFDWFKDGAGYFLAAKTWVPLVPERRAFILYLCWEQANLRGNPTRLEELTDTEAVVSIEPIYLKLYGQTGHLQQQISKVDYQKLFQIVWQDRAEQAGWRLEPNCTDARCVFRFTAIASPAGID